MLQKLNLDMSSDDKTKSPTKDEMKRGLQTIFRFKSMELVYRSNDILGVIDQMLRGKDLNRNYLRDIQMINFMTKGDLFLDYLPISNQKIKIAMAKERGEIIDTPEQNNGEDENSELNENGEENNQLNEVEVSQNE